jgi:hypothetical protein
VFIDETAITTNMVRVRGRCPRGERLVSYVPQGKWKTLTFIAGLRHNRMTVPPAPQPLTHPALKGTDVY